MSTKIEVFKMFVVLVILIQLKNKIVYTLIMFVVICYEGMGMESIFPVLAIFGE